MAYRLTKIVTRSGDDGTTSLGDGTRTVKESPRIEAIGTLDEVNSLIGLVLAQGLPGPAHEVLQQAQHNLFTIGGELSLPGREILEEQAVLDIERHIVELNQELPPLREFVLPGGSPPCACCHVARSVCRRAERRMWKLSREEPVSRVSLRYINRLSDLLFVLARRLGRAAGSDEVTWDNAGAGARRNPS